MTVAMMIMILHMSVQEGKEKKKHPAFPFLFRNAAVGKTHTNQEKLLCGSGNLEGHKGL